MTEDKISIEMDKREYALFIAGLYHIVDEPCHYIGSKSTSYAYKWAEKLKEQYGQPDDDLLED